MKTVTNGRANPAISFTDTGGTFTDTFVVDEAGNYVLGKAPTTPDDLSQGYFASVEEAAGQMNLSLAGFFSRVQVVGYGSTTLINAVLTRRGAQVGLLVTAGMEDILYIERGKQTWIDLSYQDKLHSVTHMHNEPLVPKRRTRGIEERMTCLGSVVVPLRDETVRQAVRDLLVRERIEALAICFMWSFVNPEHERRAAAVAREVMAEVGREVPVYLSVDVNPVIREHSRMNTTVVEAYGDALARGSLLAIDRRIKELGHKGDLQIMLSYGGLAPVEHVRMVETMQSGPVGGLLGGRHVGELYGFKNVVTTDVGGTSFDVGIISGGQISVNREPVCARLILGVPMCWVDSIGAGGGTLVRIDQLTGRVDVGPESAGAVPGPVCYDRGGEEPTITDVDLICGYIDPDNFLGGRIRLNSDKALRVFRQRIADPLGLDPLAAAAGVRELVDVRMRNHLLGMIWQRGYSPADYHLMSYGGAGPTHVAGYAAGLGFKGILVFPFAAVFSAFGAAAADYEHRYIRSLNLSIPSGAKPEVKVELGQRLTDVWDDLERQALAQMEREGFRTEEVRLQRLSMTKYAGQFNDLAVVAPITRVDDPDDMDALIRAFEELYADVYASAARYPQAGYNIFEAGLVSSVPKMRPVLRRPEQGGPMPPSESRRGERPAWSGSGLVPTPVYDMERLQAGNRVEGPALIEHPTTVLVVPAGAHVEVDEMGALWLKGV